MYIKVIIASSMLLFIVIMITQVIVPLWNNRKLFPIFNKSKTDLIDGIKTLQDLEEEQRLAEELQRRTDKLLKRK